MGEKAIEPPTCMIILGTAFLMRPSIVVVVVDVRRQVPGLGVAHVEVQHGGSGVVAIHCLLDLLGPT